MRPTTLISLFFFFNDTATTEIYTLSLHDALPISDHRSRVGDLRVVLGGLVPPRGMVDAFSRGAGGHEKKDRKSTRLNSSHSQNSYAVFCLKKKKTTHAPHHHATRT